MLTVSIAVMVPIYFTGLSRFGVSSAVRLKWTMAGRIIYLDQNKWIELARAANGNATPELHQVLEILRESKRFGNHVPKRKQK